MHVGVCSRDVFEDVKLLLGAIIIRTRPTSAVAKLCRHCGTILRYFENLSLQFVEHIVMHIFVSKHIAHMWQMRAMFNEFNKKKHV